jgi:hypothetical protein
MQTTLNNNQQSGQMETYIMRPANERTTPISESINEPTITSAWPFKSDSYYCAPPFVARWFVQKAKPTQDHLHSNQSVMIDSTALLWPDRRQPWTETGVDPHQEWRHRHTGTTHQRGRGQPAPLLPPVHLLLLHPPPVHVLLITPAGGRGGGGARSVVHTSPPHNITSSWW